MKTILVTGGCGFIGSHFVRLLIRQRKWRIVNVDTLTYAGDLARLGRLEDRDRYRFIRADIAEPAMERIFKQERPDAVVNFAAESHVDRSILDSAPFLRTNVIGVQVLLDLARGYDVARFVQISTDEVYGDAEGAAPFVEESLLRPSSPYSASKAAADLLCLAYQRTHGAPVLIARSSNNYGPYQFPEKLIPLMIRNGLSGEPLPVYGDGKQVRDWLFVGDNCAAILKILETGAPGAVYNVSAGELRTNLNVVESVCRIVAAETRRDPRALIERIQLVPDRPGHDRAYVLDSQKIRRELGWEPRVTFEEGLRETVRWYLKKRAWMARVTSGEFRSYYDAVYRGRWKRKTASSKSAGDYPPPASIRR